jgi:hypothetical protein
VFWTSSTLSLVLGRPAFHLHDVVELLALPGLVLVAVLVLKRRWVRRTGAEQGLGLVRFRFGAEGVELRTSTGHLQLHFHDEIRQLKTPLGVWLYAGGRRPLFVPRRAFDVEQLRRLAPLFAERLPVRRDRWRWFEIGCLTLVVLLLFLTAWHHFVTVPTLEELRREQPGAAASTSTVVP